MSEAGEASGAPAPRANPHLLGQTAAEAVLARAAGEGRLPHAWLLTGPRGVGKATLAYRFARYLLAEGATGGAGPGLFDAVEPPAEDLALAADHPVFRRVASGGHLDLMALEPRMNEETGRRRSEIRVDEVRKVVNFLHMTPGEGGWRIVVVDAADELNASAANALLKVLEEPPRQAVMLLVSHAPGRLLATIRSRCCHLALTPLEQETVVELLARYAPDLAPEDAAALAKLCAGSIGRALELAETGGLALYGELVALLGGVAGVGEQARAGLDVGRLYGLGERVARGTDPGPFRATRELLLWWLARLIRARSLGRAPEEVVPGERAVLAGLAARASLAQWIALWDKVSHLLTRVESANLDRKQALVAAFLEVEALAGAR